APKKPTDPKPNPPQSPQSPRRWNSIFWYVLLAMILLWAWQEATTQTVQTIPYSKFKDYVARKEVAEAAIRPDEIRGVIKPKEGKGKAPATSGEFNFRTVRVEDKQLVEALQKSGAEFTGVRPSIFSEILWTWIIPLGLMFLLWSFLSRRLG